MKKKVILTKNKKSLLENRNIPVECHYCRIPLDVGEVIIRNGFKWKGYHPKCWNKLFLDI